MKTFEVGGKEYPLRYLRKWQRALRSGKYKQTTGRLEDKIGFCCLGVGCKVLIPKSRLVLEIGGFITGNLPIAQKASPEWFKAMDNDFHRKTGTQLARINDVWDLGEKTFPFIAEMLELVYVEKVYDRSPEADTVEIDLNLILENWER